MKQLMIWVADDGVRFDTEIECANYEACLELDRLIAENITYTYNDDAGFGIIEEADVKLFIKNYFNEIESALKTLKGKRDV